MLETMRKDGQLQDRHHLPKESDSVRNAPSDTSHIGKVQRKSPIPDWGDLPHTDMTISGFGKQAMQTHLAEKALTMDSLSKLHKSLRMCPSEDRLEDDPEHLRVKLLPHQKHGLSWMLWREKETPSGGILADDMGLGKTLSMIALVLKDKENKENASFNDKDSSSDSPNRVGSKKTKIPEGGTLVVCPASVVGQWESEIYRRVKKKILNVEVYHGTKRETNPRRLAEHDVVVTTYNLVSKENGAFVRDKGPLFLIKWHRVILDEAHVIRNHKTGMAEGVCDLKAKYRWCLTGTPIQNKELDLFALFKFLRCSPFDDLTVWKKWVGNNTPAGMQRLSTILKSVMLRRTKEQLQEKGDLNCLPDKTIEDIEVHLDLEELQIYEKVAVFSQTLFAQFLAQRAEKQQMLDARYGFSSTPAWKQGDRPNNQFTTTSELAEMHRKMIGLTEVKSHEILVLLLRLRQICCHPGLVKKMVEDGDLHIGGALDDDPNGLDDAINNLNINESNFDDSDMDAEGAAADRLNNSGVISEDHPALSMDRPSAKIRAVLDMLQTNVIDSDDKAVIVSQWTSVLDIIAKFLTGLHITFDTLSGKVAVKNRQEIIDNFNRESSGPQVLLLSLTAGGVGLNLVGANHLMLIDIHWNPQLEAQACDRIYRVGQQKNVFVYRFITKDTIEERVKLLQDRKLALAGNVLTGTRSTEVSKLTLDDLQLLFSAPKPPKKVTAPENFDD